MSTFASICHNEEHNDQIDVAYSHVNNEIRLTVWKDQDGFSTTTFLVIDEAKHLVNQINEGIQTIRKLS